MIMHVGPICACNVYIYPVRASMHAIRYATDSLVTSVNVLLILPFPQL